MKRRAAFLSLVALALALAWPAASSATQPNNQSASYQFFLEVPNSAQASSGNTISLTGDGTFGVHPKSASGGGSFTYTPAGGASSTGTWTVNGLVDFQPYGCGIVFGTIIPPNLCGGRLVLDVTFVGDFGSRPGMVTVYCLIGSPPPNTEEGVRVVIPGLANFNRQIGGMNVYVKQ